MYRDTVEVIDDLHDHEQLALGGLIRVLIRQDRQFSEAEEAQLEQVGAQIGGADALFGVIERSAETLRDDDAIREAAMAVERPEARMMIRETLEEIALAETIGRGEQQLLDWCDQVWGTTVS